MGKERDTYGVEGEKPEVLWGTRKKRQRNKGMNYNLSERTLQQRKAKFMSPNSKPNTTNKYLTFSDEFENGVAAKRK